MFPTRLLVLAPALVVCAAAVADIRVFVTSSASGYGLDLLGPQGDGTGTDPEHEDWPIDPFRPTYSTVDVNNYSYYAYDYYFAYYRAAAYPPIDAPSGTVDNPILIDAGAGQWGYIWFQYRNEPAYASIRGFFETREADGGWPPPSALKLTYYLQNDMEEYGRKRWMGMATPPEYPEWRNNSQELLELLTYGLRNGSDDPRNMFDHQSGTNPRTGVGLLGAVTGQARDTVYKCYLSVWDYEGGGVPAQGPPTFFKFVPEPAGVSLVALAAVWLRRRRS
jgi:MYXO-CTERM domain-containing protein